MADIDPQLVKAIADAVTAALKARGQSASGAPASLHPPIGVCTGDYSQFKDRPDLTGGSTNPTPSALKPRAEKQSAEAPDRVASTQPAPIPGPPPLTGIITAQQLQDAITASPDGRALIASNARLTPLANDFVREHPLKIRRDDASASPASSGVSGSAPAGSGYLYWSDGHCPAVQALTARLAGKLTPTTASAKEHEVGRVVRDISATLANRRAAGAILFVKNAALPVIAANRCPSLRAVVGSCAASVDSALQQVAANVLIIEYPFVSPGTINAMVDRFVQGSPSIAAHLQRELTELHRSGR